MTIFHSILNGYLAIIASSHSKSTPGQLAPVFQGELLYVHVNDCPTSARAAQDRNRRAAVLAAHQNREADPLDLPADFDNLTPHMRRDIGLENRAAKQWSDATAHIDRDSPPALTLRGWGACSGLQPGERRVSQPQAIRRLQRTQGAAHLSFGISGVQRWREDGAAKVRLPRRPSRMRRPRRSSSTRPAASPAATGSIGRSRPTAQTWWPPPRPRRRSTDPLGDEAEIHSRLTGSSGARLYWLPQEAILFDGARLRRTLEVDLTGGATLLALEATVFGRRAMGESIARSRLPRPLARAPRRQARLRRRCPH